jgi:hypothetical protein
VTRQQRMGEQSRLSKWPDVNVLKVYDFFEHILMHLFYIALFTSFCWVPGIRRGMHELRWQEMKCRVERFYQKKTL